MKGFKMDNSGDVVIENNQIQLVSGIDLIAQLVRQVIGTNIGEWFGDEEEGIDNDVILTKNPNYDLIEDTINTAVQQVADTQGVEINTDNFDFAVNGRHMFVTFTMSIGEDNGVTMAVEL